MSWKVVLRESFINGFAFYNYSWSGSSQSHTNTHTTLHFARTYIDIMHYPASNPNYNHSAFHPAVFPVHTACWPAPEKSLPWWQSAAAAHWHSWYRAAQSCSPPDPVATQCTEELSGYVPHHKKSMTGLLFWPLGFRAGYQPQNHRCQLFPPYCPSLWDSTSRWFAPATNQTALNTRLWQWHLCNRQHRERLFTFYSVNL